MMIVGQGWVAIPDAGLKGLQPSADKDTYQVSMYHQLHCIVSIEDAVES